MVTCIAICDLRWVGTNVIGRRHHHRHRRHRRHRHHRRHRRRALTLASAITITEASIDASDVTRLSLDAAKVWQHLLGHSSCRDGCIEKMRLRDAFENGRTRLLVYGQRTRDLIVTRTSQLVGESKMTRMFLKPDMFLCYVLSFVRRS